MGYFCMENQVLEHKIDEFFTRLSKFNDDFCKGELSIILLGSLSRGEGTWLEGENSPILVSDIEFFTVYPSGFSSFSEFTIYMNNTAETIFVDQKSKLFHIDNTFVCRTRLGSMERKLLTYDAKQMGKTVVGSDAVKLLPEITLENINLWDIRDILVHRAFSVLYYGMPLKQQGKESEYRYNLAKNSLDLMTVMLVTYGKLESGFRNRFDAICKLPIPEAVKCYFAYCLSVKLSFTSKNTYNLVEMEQMFLQLLKALSHTMNIPKRNTWVNRKYIVRRLLGMCKRALLYRHIPVPGHLKRLIRILEKNQKLSHRELLDNLVLNGYPEIGKMSSWSEC